MIKKVIKSYLNKKSGELKDQYYTLFKQLKDETSHLSVHDQNNETYQEILKLGSGIVPFILEDLKSDPDWWHFMILRKVSGKDLSKVPKEIRGMLYEVRDWTLEQFK